MKLAMLSSKTPFLIQKPAHLYRKLLRDIKKLPKESQSHYKHHVRQGFNSHADETDPSRISQIMSRALDDMDWLIKKYSK
ncbi:LYR motif-containing protein 9 [Octopus bimaculoides]|uniref:LYR motif-containing protein 9 n=1 Tax=Octopus bimaculoides TaxID=37653 RepID=A0A0L8HDQ0_OCTBM|nr:LYR motif-containing protein 9 [Octopus bimaculoides]|eukprot:XP_014773114.1 PREDICTED: LYR motif-containing protein 9-like [Octopus bimaculoides]